MSSQIYQLNYDYEQQKDHFLVVQSGNNEKLTSDDLAAIQVNMLKSNAIEKILPVEIEEINFDVRLFYKITNKRMLTNVLREQPLLLHDLYNILFHIVSGIENSSKYMLHDRNFILHDEFIFIGESLNDVFMTYLPLNQVNNKPALKVELKDLLIRLVGYVKELTGDGVQQLMNELDKDTFHLTTFVKMVNDLRQKSDSDTLNNRQSHGTQQPVHKVDNMSVPPAVRVNDPIVNSNPSGKRISYSKPGKPQSNPPSDKVGKQKPVPSVPRESKQVKANANEDEMVTKEEKGKPNLLITIVLTAFVALVTWKLYEMNPSTTVLLLCIVLNILTVAGGIFYFLFKKNGGIKKTSKSTENKQMKKNKKTTKKPKGQKENRQTIEHALRADSQQNEVASTMQPSAPNLDAEQYFRNLQNETTVLSANPGTVLLNEDPSVQEGPYLQVERDNGPERIAIKTTTFTVGRNSNGTDYMENTVGISRLHFEVKIIDEKFNVKDLGAKNGTTLNGEPLVPYKLYPLKESDTITAGKVTYSFHKQ